VETNNLFRFSNKNYVPIPIELTSSLLKEIDSYVEFKCIFRTIALIYGLRPKRIWITFEELIGDPVLQESFQSTNTEDIKGKIIEGLLAAKKRKTILIREKTINQIENSIILVNDKISNDLLAKNNIASLNTLDLEQPEFQYAQKKQINIYSLYENNIGHMTPMMAEELKLAETKYPDIWIEEAFMEAVKNNIRNWKYISSILNRWETEGKTNGESTRYSKESKRENQLRRAQRFRDEFINKKP
jgi:DNA replication protein